MKTMLILTIALVAASSVALPVASAGGGIRCDWSLSHVECDWGIKTVDTAAYSAVEYDDALTSATLA